MHRPDSTGSTQHSRPSPFLGGAGGQQILVLGKHPWGPVKLDLQARGVCRELALEFLTRADLDRYLALEFPEHWFPEEFADLVHARTEGSPLFMANLLRYCATGRF